MNSAAGAPAAATTTPAIAGPSMNVAEKAMLRVAFACRSAACVNASRSLPRAASHSTSACSRAARAVSARNSALAASAAVPSSAARIRIAGSQKCHSSTASSVVTTPSNRYSPLSTPRRCEASTRAASAGAANAGSAWPEISSAATATALCVWSKTATDSATKPNQVPSRLTV